MTSYIRKIVRVEERTNNQTGKPYKLTFALMVDGNEEYSGFGTEFEVGDKVIIDHHRGVNKMWREIPAVEKKP